MTSSIKQAKTNTENADALRFSRHAMASPVDLSLWMMSHLRTSSNSLYVGHSDVEIWREQSMRMRNHLSWTAAYFLRWWDAHGRFVVIGLATQDARIERVARALNGASVLFYLNQEGGRIGRKWDTRRHRQSFHRWGELPAYYVTALRQAARALLGEMALPQPAQEQEQEQEQE